MHRLMAALEALVLLTALVVVAAPAELACCAGVIPMHGPDCCESVETDASARSCCEGGTAAIAVLAERSTPPSVAALASSAAVSLAEPLSLSPAAPTRTTLLALGVLLKRSTTLRL